MHSIIHLKPDCMKYITRLTMLVLATSLFIASCTKGDLSSSDAISATISNDASTPDLSKCKIRRIYQQRPFTVETALFTYNRVNNPYSVVYANSGTSYPSHYFFYDSKNRLKEYRLNWGDYYTHEFHYYRYNDKNQIIV